MKKKNVPFKTHITTKKGNKGNNLSFLHEIKTFEEFQHEYMHGRKETCSWSSSTGASQFVRCTVDVSFSNSLF